MKSSNKLSFRDRIARANSRGDFDIFVMTIMDLMLILQGQEISCVCWRMKPSGGVYSIPLSMQD